MVSWSIGLSFAVTVTAGQVAEVNDRRLRSLGGRGSTTAEWIDALALPPRTLIATSMELAVVQPTNWDGEAVANSSSHRPLLCKFYMMGVGGGAAANETRMGGHKLEVFAVTLAHRFTDDGDLVSTGLAPPFVCFSLL